MRRVLGLILVAASGLVVVFDGFAPELGLGSLRHALVDGAIILAAFALLAGAINLLLWHVRRVRAGQAWVALSVLLLMALAITAAIVIVLPTGAPLDWIYAHLYEPVQASLMALLAFYAVSAAYRTFALRTFDAVLLMVSATLLLLLQLPFATSLSPAVSVFRDWLYRVPIAGIVRGVLIGAALGAVTVSLRALLGHERPQVGK